MLEQLIAKRTELLLQRSQAKDVIENCEQAIGQVSHTIQALEAQVAEAKAKAEADAKENDSE